MLLLTDQGDGRFDEASCGRRPRKKVHVHAPDAPSPKLDAPVFEEPLFYVPRRSINARSAPAELKEFGSDTFVMVPDRCGLARLTRGLFAAANLPLNTYAGEAMSYHVLQEWAALDLGSAILPASRLTSDVRAVPLMRAPLMPATVTYRVVWHRESRRGKELAALLRPYRPQRPAATPRT